MGGINVASALGQPLKADIELVVVNKAEKASLVARLASPDVYRGAGLEYPYGSKFKFQIESRANGESYIKVSSVQPINDPFVSMLVELTWASGKLLREYTFLLDPPDYVAEQPKQAEVQAVGPAVQAAPPEAAAKPVEQAAPVATAPVESQPTEKPASKPAMVAPAKPAAAVPAEKSVATGSITVNRGDTLNKIAMQNKPAEVSLERMLVALYRANADQFDGKNMNRIKAGKILRLPDQSELMGVAQSDAAKEIRAQTANWNVYRQKLAAAAPAASQPQEAQQVATGKIASSVADKAPVAKESAKEVLKLSKGEAPGDKAATGAAGKSMSAQDKKNAEQEDAIAKTKGLKEEQARAALLEKNLQDMQRLAQLKSEAAALAQTSGAASAVPGPASAVAAASSVAAASEVKPAPVAKPKPKPQPAVVPQPSMVDKILGEPLYLIGGAAILLGLGGIGFMLSRRKQAPAAGGQSEDVGATTGHITAPVAPSPETGDFTSAAVVHAETTPQPDDVDPISEADLFLNFGRDAQAEEILKEALQNTPNNHQIHLKLLGIYAARKDVNSFSVIARQLKDSGDEEAWPQAAAMGRKLEPNNPMYGGAGTIEDDGSATMQTTMLNAMPDFVMDDTAVQETSTPDVDFDLGDTEKTSTLSTDDKAVAQAEAMDFDVTSTRPSLSAPTEMDFDITSTSPSMPAATGEPETALPNLDDLIFDVTSTHPSMPAVQPEASKPAAQADDAGMEFTLDFPVEGVAEKPAPVAQAETGLAGISLNFDGAATPGEPASDAKDEHWHEVATKLDLAKAYQEMGDGTGAREILDEVMREGDAGQREAAQSMLDQLG
ncbi:MAG: hypothetical protein PHG89_04930 [Gallionella sp.]|nr:hypothetical protein [Gallionella sp.]